MTDPLPMEYRLNRKLDLATRSWLTERLLRQPGIVRARWPGDDFRRLQVWIDTAGISRVTLRDWIEHQGVGIEEVFEGCAARQATELPANPSDRRGPGFESSVNEL